MLRPINVDLDSKHIKSYATQAALLKRIDQDKDLYPEHDDRFLVVQTPKGRWTAIVQLDMSKGGYVGRYPFIKI
jgi:V8-like Glu-specific endopeptidase